MFACLVRGADHSPFDLDVNFLSKIHSRNAEDWKKFHNRKTHGVVELVREKDALINQLKEKHSLVGSPMTSFRTDLFDEDMLVVAVKLHRYVMA